MDIDRWMEIEASVEPIDAVRNGSNRFVSLTLPCIGMEVSLGKGTETCRG